MTVQNLKELLNCCLPQRQTRIDLHLSDKCDSNYTHVTNASNTVFPYPGLKNCYTDYKFTITMRQLLLTHMEVDGKVKRFFVPMGEDKAALITRKEYVHFNCVKWKEEYETDKKYKDHIMNATNEELLDIFVREKFLRKINRFYWKDIILTKYHLEGFREAVYQHIPYNISVIDRWYFHYFFYPSKRQDGYSPNFGKSTENTVDYQLGGLFCKEVIKYVEDNFLSPYNLEDVANELFHIKGTNWPIVWYLTSQIHWNKHFLHDKKWLKTFNTTAKRREFFVKKEWPLSRLYDSLPLDPSIFK